MSLNAQQPEVVFSKRTAWQHTHLFSNGSNASVYLCTHVKEYDVVLLHFISISEWQNYIIQVYLLSFFFFARRRIFFVVIYYFLGFFERPVYWSVLSSYLTMVVIVQQVHHISVSALPIHYNIMIKTKHQGTFLWGKHWGWRGTVSQWKAISQKEESLEKLFSMESTSGSCTGTKRWGQEERVARSVPCL